MSSPKLFLFVAVVCNAITAGKLYCAQNRTVRTQNTVMSTIYNIRLDVWLGFPSHGTNGSRENHMGMGIVTSD